MKRVFTHGFPFFILLSFVLSGFVQVNAQNVIRGPYLQFPTSTSIKIKWRTDVATTAKVSYGTSMTGLGNSISTGIPTTEHTIELFGLNPYTKYYYKIGTATQDLSGPDSLHYFVTSPTIGTVQPIRAWVIGDFGKGNSEQAAVRDAFSEFRENNPTDVWLWLGDNAYDDGTDQEYQDKVFNVYTDIMKNLPFMPSPGNHDYISIAPPWTTSDPPTHNGPYYDIVDVPTNGEIGGVPSGYELYYSFDYGNVHFISLNSEIGSLLSSSDDWLGTNPFSTFVTSPMLEWLEDDLIANDKMWTVVYFHQPPHTKGSHKSDTFWELYMKAMRENYMPLVEQYGVDLVLGGHSHVYERSFLIHGHYGDIASFNPSTMILDNGSGRFALGEPYVKYTNGPTPNHGTVHIVCGNSASKDDDANLDHPAMFYGYGCDTCIGSFIIEVDSNRLDGKFLAASGDIMDHFTILKQPDPSTAILENDFISELKIHPNPFDEKTNVEFSITEAGNVSVEVLDLSGKQLLSVVDKMHSPGKYKYQIDGEDLGGASGTFVVKIARGDQVVSQRVVRVK